MRTRSSLPLAIATLTLGLAPAASAVDCPGTGDPWYTTIWFSNSQTPLPYNDSANWTRTPQFPPLNPCGTQGLPRAGEPTYIGEGATALIEEGDSLLSGDLYVGGYDSHYEGVNPGFLPPSSNDVGTLDVSGGQILVNGCDDSPFTDQDCYGRVGYRGAEGTVNQSGGYVEIATILSIGMGSIDADGVYNLSGGQLKGAIDVAVQGNGELNVTGGEVLRGCCDSIVGRGYEYGGQTGTGVIPGYGLLTQSGGITNFWGVWLGFESPPSGGVSHGEIEVSGGEFNAGQIRGRDGNGEIRVTGGSFDVDVHFMVGERQGRSHSLEISGGTVRQLSDAEWWRLNPDPETLKGGLYVGSVGEYQSQGPPGHGEITIVGDDATITVAGDYWQGADSKLIVKLGPDSPHVSTIQVADTAHFEEGAQLQVELLPGYTPEEGTIYTLLTAGSIVGDPIDVIDPGNEWVAIFDGNPANTLKLGYWPGHPPCGLTGIEPVVLILLARATKRKLARATSSPAMPA